MRLGFYCIRTLTKLFEDHTLTLFLLLKLYLVDLLAQTHNAISSYIALTELHCFLLTDMAADQLTFTVTSTVASLVLAPAG